MLCTYIRIYVYSYACRNTCVPECAYVCSASRVHMPSRMCQRCLRGITHERMWELTSRDTFVHMMTMTSSDTHCSLLTRSSYQLDNGYNYKLSIGDSGDSSRWRWVSVLGAVARTVIIRMIAIMVMLIVMILVLLSWVICNWSYSGK